MSQYRIDLDSAEWQTPLEGVRHRQGTSFGRKLRLVEYTRSMPAHWCSTGHFGVVLVGRLEIEFDQEAIIFAQGDGICIPDGSEHRHRACLLSDVAGVFFVEEEEK